MPTLSRIPLRDRGSQPGMVGISHEHRWIATDARGDIKGASGPTLNVRPNKASHTKVQSRLSIRESRTQDPHQHDRRRRAADLRFAPAFPPRTASDYANAHYVNPLTQQAPRWQVGITVNSA